ncbi:hypothetical protein ABIE37_000377 [Arthrobacter bambusae]|uniref:Uncharacterized protein n=1 Tax=Arthrobacter bambusae TaxID=1338426 RepID=A0ABV2P1Q5_9MICC
MPTTDVPGGRSCHDARCRLRHVIDEGGASTVSSDSSFWRVECHRVLSCSTDRRGSGLGGRGLILTGGFTRTKWYRPAGKLRRRQRRFPGAGYECAGTRQVFGVRPNKKEVWTMSTLSTSDRLVQPPDWPGFLTFPPLPSATKAWNPVRVPPRARHTPSSEGVFALTCVHSGWSGPSDTGRGVCLAPRVACLVVGERVQGRGWRALRWL